MEPQENVMINLVDIYRPAFEDLYDEKAAKIDYDENLALRKPRKSCLRIIGWCYSRIPVRMLEAVNTFSPVEAAKCVAAALGLLPVGLYFTVRKPEMLIKGYFDDCRARNENRRVAAQLNLDDIASRY